MKAYDRVIFGAQRSIHGISISEVLDLKIRLVHLKDRVTEKSSSFLDMFWENFIGDMDSGKSLGQSDQRLELSDSDSVTGLFVTKLGTSQSNVAFSKSKG